MIVAATPVPAPSPSSTSIIDDLTPDTVAGRVIGTPVAILITLLVAVLLRLVWGRVIDAVVRRVARTEHLRTGESSLASPLGAILPAERRRQRAEAVGTLLRSLGTVVIVSVAAIVVLALLGVNVGPIIAGAGVVGIALGFGAQSLVKDFISGVFMVFEDQYGVGDVIDTGSVVGTVEDVGLRITRVRDLNGVVWYIRNGEIVNLGNRSQGWALVSVDMPVAFDQDLGAVRAVVGEVGRQLIDDASWRDLVLEPPTVAGVESVTGAGVVVRVVARAAGQQQLPVGREVRERLVAAFDAAGIRRPLPPAPQGPGGSP